MAEYYTLQVAGLTQEAETARHFRQVGNLLHLFSFRCGIDRGLCQRTGGKMCGTATMITS